MFVQILVKFCLSFGEIYNGDAEYWYIAKIYTKCTVATHSAIPAPPIGIHF